MGLNEAQIRALRPEAKRYAKALGGGLLIQVYPNGGKYFVWRHRFPPSRQGALSDYQIGPYGSGVGKWSLSQARIERDRLEVLRKQGENPRQLKAAAKREIVTQCNLTFGEVVAKWRESSFGSLAATTIKDYNNKVNNQILPEFERRDIKSVSREECIAFKKSIEARGAKNHSDKVFMIIRQIFEYAIDMQWVSEPNPARSSRYTKSDHVPEHHPSLTFEELPHFISALCANNTNAQPVTVASVKILLITFLRVGGLCPAKWSDIDWEKRIWTIPADDMKAMRLNRVKHQIPMPDKLIEILTDLHLINGHTEYVFWSPRSGNNEYLSLASPNAHIIKLGYKGKLVAHGVRSMANTMGIDELKYPHELIDLQLGHKKKGKVRQAYDRSQQMEERTEFMNAWAQLLVDNGLT